MPDADYRDSHLQMGATYDSRLSQEPFSLYAEAIQKGLIRDFVARQFGQAIPRYLDFACGTGRMTGFLAPMAASSFGVDVSESMIGAARIKCPNTQFFVRDITREPLDIAPVDVVSAFRFFGNAQDELRRAALAAIARQLAPGGWLVINNHRNPLTLQHMAHRMAGGDEPLSLTYFKMRRLLGEAGFAVERCCGIGWWVAMARMTRPGVLDSAAVRALEPISRLAPISPFCPDMLFFARKAR